MSVWNVEKSEWWPHHITVSAWLGHTPFAAWLIPALQPKVIVELGTHRGVSYMAFCQANAKTTTPAKCFAVDTWQGDEHAGRYDETIFEEIEKLNREYEKFSRLLRCRFDDALAEFENGTVDLLHIDGFHTYEAVSHDFHSWLPKMSEKGIILFHDTQVRDRNFGVWRLWQELSDRYPHFNFEHSSGLGLLIVGSHAPEIVLHLCKSVDENGGANEFRKSFAERGQEVVEYHQRLLQDERQNSWSGRWKHRLKILWRSWVPLSIRKSLGRFR